MVYAIRSHYYFLNYLQISIILEIVSIWYHDIQI